MKKWVVKYRNILFSIIASLAFAFYYFSVFSTNYISAIPPFQEKFQKLEQQMDAFLLTQKAALKVHKKNLNWNNFDLNPTFNLHVYHKDSLLIWNTNQVPIIRFADIHFPAEGIIHLQNGWYNAKVIKEGDYTLCASFLIKQDYSYENKDLTNKFVSGLELPFDASISLEQAPSFSVFSKQKSFLFSLIPNEYQPATEAESIALLLLLLASISLWLVALLKITIKIRKPYNWLLPLVLIIIRILSLSYNWFGFLQDTHGFQATLYGMNAWFPNFFEYLVNCTVIIFIISFFKHVFSSPTFIKNNRLIGLIFFLSTIPFWALILYLNKGLIENSSIPLIIENLFSLNSYSILAIASMGLLFYSYFTFTKTIIHYNKLSKNNPLILSIVLFMGGLVFFFYEMNFGYELVFASLFPLLLNALIIYLVYREGKSYQLGFGIIFLGLFSLVSALNLMDFNNRKEKSERELYANQLATEKDIVTEIEYSNIKEKIKEDNGLKIFISSPLTIGLSDFEEGLERRIFNGFWERYEMNFNLYDLNGKSLLLGGDNRKNAYEYLNEIISKHGIVSEIDSNMFFVSDYTGQYSYIIQQPIKIDTSSAVLYCTLKSKKIPEEIGFPRLLISSKAQVFESLEKYAIAKYHKNRLITNYGGFNFPSTLKPINTWEKESKDYYNADGFNHYILKKPNHDVVILSSKNITFLELITSFSYLFSFYGILLLPILFQFNYTPIFKRTLSLAVKIQLVLIGLVFVSLLAFSYGSGLFVSNQYNQYTQDVIKEKLTSVEMELRNKLASQKNLSLANDGNYIAYLLQNFSKVFVTDINFYDTGGYMIASSRPKVFNMGLLSEQMNPLAIKAFLVNNKSELIHDECIGNLNYTSAYLPFYNHEGKLLGFLNLQHFGQQKDFENQIQKFLVAIINVFMLLLAISIVLAIFISNWVTAPLRLLQDNFSKIRFGKHNQQISYNKEDEIGALVKDYNKKLEELEFTAQQLAQSERESAWREMAKQVAHEIKNPLTPMKLSLQQLLRVYNANDPESENKVKKVADSIIEQIDALTKIANEFSNFAKMPRPEEVTMDLLPIIKNVSEVFRQEANCEITIETTLKTVNVKADKDQMIRTFNNLIKNAIQSIPENKEGKIRIRIKKEEKQFLIEIEDNGTGIPQDKKPNIFVPYFTTKSAGTGLGLAMVKQIVENHNGTIYFTTKEGKGTSFTIEFPRVD